jgi:hypothetical protein
MARIIRTQLTTALANESGLEVEMDYKAKHKMAGMVGVLERRATETGVWVVYNAETDAEESCIVEIADLVIVTVR